MIGAYFIGLLTKDIVSFVVSDRFCFRQRLYAWPALAAPLLAGATHYAVLRWVTGLIWQGDQVTSVLIMFVGILLSFPLFAFFYGLYGGWNDAGLGELHKGASWPDSCARWRRCSGGPRAGRADEPAARPRGDRIQAAAEADAAGLMAERVELAGG